MKTMKIHNKALLAPVLLLFALLPNLVQAGADLGTFCWRIDIDSQITGDVVCLDVEQNNISFGLTGIAISQELDLSGPVFGAGTFDTFNPGVFLATLDVLGIAFLAAINTSTLNGVWAADDWTGNFVDTGELIFLGPVASVGAAKELIQAPAADSPGFLEKLKQSGVQKRLTDSLGK